MENITLKWSKEYISINFISQSKDEYLDEKGFYAFIAGKHKEKKLENPKLLYIGQAYEQTLRVRIPQDHKKAEKCINKYLKDNPDTTVWVQTGIITESDVKTRTQPLYDDIECCLIFTNQPKCNTHCMDNYDGREIKITNTGLYGILKKTSSCAPKKS